MMKRLLLIGLMSSPAFGASGTVAFDLDVNLPKMDAKGSCPVSGGEVVDGKLQGTFVVDLKACKTGMDARDEHMYEVLEVAKDSTAELSFDQPVVMTGTQNFKGLLNFHNTLKPVEGKITFNGQSAKAEFKIDYTNFGLAQVTKLGATVAKIIPISVDLKL